VATTYTYVAAHGYLKDTACNENDRLLHVLEKIQQCCFVATTGIHPVGLENSMGQGLAVLHDEVACVAEGEGLQQNGYNKHK